MLDARRINQPRPEPEGGGGAHVETASVAKKE